MAQRRIHASTAATECDECSETAARLSHSATRLEQLVSDLERRTERAPDCTQLELENERLLTLLRTHPPPRPTMLPQRRLRLAAAQSWRCATCATMLSECFHADHKTPWCETYDDRDSNISIVCVPCHMAKTSAEQSHRRRSAVACAADSAEALADTE